jgi:rhodanese-related sulfurtransferase
MSLSSSQTYAGDLSVAEAWDMLTREPRAQLIDVRTMAEWSFVGLPDIAPLGRQVLCIEWQGFPTMQPNTDFVAEVSSLVQQAGGARDTPILFICRSGARSRSAAMAMTEAGFPNSFNIAGGFEGDLDAKRHRGQLSGWKAAGLPWKQS